MAEIVCFLLLLLASPAYLYPQGAPISMAIVNVPHHGAINPQTTSPPYEILVSPNSYSPGDTLTVRFQATTGQFFRGFQVRALQVGGNPESFFGNFTEIPANTQAFVFNPDQTFPWSWDYVCHNDNSSKTEVIVKWKAPSQSVGEFIFKGGFVKSYDTYWTNVTSQVITPLVSKQVNYPKIQVSPKLPFNLGEECGVTKGCVLYPYGCSGAECTHGVGYQRNAQNNATQFEVFGKASGYLTVGFSHDNKMGDDSTVTCTVGPLEPQVHFGLNPANFKYNSRAILNPNDLTKLQVSSEGDNIYCSFEQSFSAEAIIFNIGSFAFDAYKFDYTKPSYMFLVPGPLYTNTDEPVPHDILPLVTKSKVDFSKSEKHYAVQIHEYLKAHGALAVTAWLFLAPLAFFIARHFRTQCNTMLCTAVKLCKSMLWFHMHRSLMLLAALANAALITVIFVYLKAWTLHATLHAVFGLVAVGLSYFNILLAAIRPNPESSNRPLFNWFHRIAGILALIAAAVALLTGANVHILNADLRKLLTLIIALWVAAIVLWQVVLEAVSCAESRNKNDANDKDSGKGMVMKPLLLAFYILLSAAAYGVIVYYIAIA